MKKTILTCLIVLTCVFAHATIQCSFFTLTLDSNEIRPIDIDGDGTNDFLLHAEYTPFVNNYIVGVSGNEIEVRSGSGVEGHRARRIESGDPVGTIAWNDTAYMIENGNGAFSGGSSEYGHVGLRLNKGGEYHYAFIEVRAPYWQANIEVYSSGYNDVAGAETRTDACPHPVGIAKEPLLEANAFIADDQLHILLNGGEAENSAMQLINITGQVVLAGQLLQTESHFQLNDISSGAYLVAILQNDKIVQRKKVFVP